MIKCNNKTLKNIKTDTITARKLMGESPLIEFRVGWRGRNLPVKEKRKIPEKIKKTFGRVTESEMNIFGKNGRKRKKNVKQVANASVVHRQMKVTSVNF